MSTRASQKALEWLESRQSPPKDEHEAVALATHALLLYHGFRPAEVAPDDTSELPSQLPSDWGGAGYGGRYRHTRSAMTFDIRSVGMGRRLVLHATAQEDDARMHTVDVRVDEHINVEQLNNNDSNNINWSNLFIRLDDLATLIAVQVAHRLVPDATKAGYEDSTREEQQEGNAASSSNSISNASRMPRPRHPGYMDGGDRNDPLRIGPPRQPFYPGLIPTGMPPDGFGSDDLVPGGLRPPSFGPGGLGGGNLMGPGQLPRRGNPNTGGWRPPFVPPGVRYDPIHPHPDNDAELPPGFEDEHQLHRRPHGDDPPPPVRSIFEAGDAQTQNQQRQPQPTKRASAPNPVISNLKGASSVLPTRASSPPQTIPYLSASRSVQPSTPSYQSSKSPFAWETSVISSSLPAPPSPPPLPNMPPISPLNLKNNSPHYKQPFASSSSSKNSFPPPPRSPLSPHQLPTIQTIRNSSMKDRQMPPRPVPSSNVRPVLDETEDSDYSDVGDYSADKDFYVPGVNEADETASQQHQQQHTIQTSTINSLAVTQQHTYSTASSRYHQNQTDSNRLSVHASSSNQIHYDDNSSFADIAEDASTDDVDDDDVDDDDDDDNHIDANGGVVRQHSNFSRLSAQSWLTVDSAQDVDVIENDIHQQQQDEISNHSIEIRHKDDYDSLNQQDEKRFSDENDHDPATLFHVDIKADCMELLKRKSYTEMSVFECCATLQAGVAAYKKKSLRRFGARRVWLSSDCSRLFWTSKKPDIAADHIKLQKVAKLRNMDREVSIDVTEGYRITLMFNTVEMAGIWVKALSCLIPLQARVQEASRGIIPPDKEREDYNLADDSFNGRTLREYMSVNSYVVLCAARGQPQTLGNKFAFSRSDGAFCGLRYIPHSKIGLLLGTSREIAVLKRLDHRNIVRYHECLKDSEHGGNYVVFEHLARGSLMDSSKLEGVQPIPENTARELIIDILNGLDYLHKLRIAHGDIRPDNLLRAVDGYLKINPIGCITYDFFDMENIIALTKARLGNESHAFLAPEQCWLTDAPMSPEGSFAMDIWSVGVVLYFMLYGRVPFGGRDAVSIQQSICNGRLRFPKSPQTSRKARTLLRRILSERNPRQRIKLSEVRADSWFYEVDQGFVDSNVGNNYDDVRVIVSVEEVASAVQQAKVRVTSSRR